MQGWALIESVFKFGISERNRKLRSTLGSDRGLIATHSLALITCQVLSLSFSLSLYLVALAACRRAGYHLPISTDSLCAWLNQRQVFALFYVNLSSNNKIGFSRKKMFYLVPKGFFYCRITVINRNRTFSVERYFFSSLVSIGWVWGRVINCFYTSQYLSS